jgi:putative DNA primase/helicase
MSVNIPYLLSKVNIIDVVSRFVSLKKEGSEYVGICPFHQDDQASLKVNEKKQIFKCFACGPGGDAIDFLKKQGYSFKESVSYLSGGDVNVVLNPEANNPAKKKIVIEWVPVSTVGAPMPNVTHPKLGNPSFLWKYLDKDSVILGLVCRFDLAEGGKEVLPLTYVTDGRRTEWRWTGIPVPRPLYNLHLIAQNPNATVLIVEGEKTADAAQRELEVDKCVVTTWIGGSNGTTKADFSPIFGRNVILWPDNDTEQKYNENHPKAGEIKPFEEQPGNFAMLEINEILKSKCEVIKWVSNPKELPHKWDCADRQWKPEELRDFVLTNLIDVPTIVKVSDSDLVIEYQKEPDPVVSPKNPELPPREIKGVYESENDYYKMLGYEEDENVKIVFYFFAFDAKTLVRLSPTSMNKSNLQLIAPLNYWEENFPGSKAKVDIDSAQNFLINTSYKVGMYRDKFIRGRGAWMEGKKLIIHTGESLLIDGENKPLRNPDSRYVYKIGEPLGFGFGQILETEEAVKLIEKLKWLLWEREINAYLLIGWCVIAPFCGVLNWRPHIWITGAAGSGKSWVMDNVIKRLMGDVALVVQGKTTEAGVRGLLKSDARPVLFDESDVDSASDKERIQSILALARSSSYSDGGGIVKGTQTGGSKTYQIRSCFAFSSIGVQLNQQSDRSRFTTLGLRSFDGVRDKSEFVGFEREWNGIVKSDFVDSLQSRTMSLIPTILKNSKTFSDAAAEVIGNRRVGDQIGSMLAGAFSLTSKKEIAYKEAVEWITNKDWSDEKGLEQTKDESQLLNIIISEVVEVEGSHGILRRTIGELISLASNRSTEAYITDLASHDRLKRIGILIKDNSVYFSNTAKGIKRIIENTPWALNHFKVLERIKGATKSEPLTYSVGVRTRGVSIPLAVLLNDNSFLIPDNPTNPIAFDSIDSEKDDLPF